MAFSHMHDWRYSLHSVMTTPAIFTTLAAAFALGLAPSQSDKSASSPQQVMAAAPAISTASAAVDRRGAPATSAWRPLSVSWLVTCIVAGAALAYASNDLGNPDIDFFPSAWKAFTYSQGYSASHRLRLLF